MSERGRRQPDFLAALSDVAADLAELFQKELCLAKAELTAKLSLTVRGSVSMVAASGCGLLAFLLLVEAAVFAIAAQGIALYWACLIVAAVLAGVCGGLYGLGRRALATPLTPTRTLQQVTEDLRVAKEQLS